MLRVLLLTPAYAPHRVISWERAVVMLWNDKVEVVEEYEEELRSPSRSIKMPAVVRLKKPFWGLKRAVKFSRHNVFTRDGFRCQYCGSPKRMGELNYDHVVPRHLGGRTVWENIVAACYPCNARKGNRTPEQAGMKLLTRPHRPKSLPLSVPRFDPRDIPASWAEYCKSYFVDAAVA